jgi:hypothetical protein
MLSLCYGHKPRPFSMSATKKYYSETLLNEAFARRNIKQTISLKVGDEIFPLCTDEEIVIASKAVASYHNQYVSSAPEDDGWEEDTNRIEQECI